MGLRAPTLGWYPTRVDRERPSEDTSLVSLSVLREVFGIGDTDTTHDATLERLELTAGSIISSILDAEITANSTITCHYNANQKLLLLPHDDFNESTLSVEYSVEDKDPISGQVTLTASELTKDHDWLLDNTRPRKAVYILKEQLDGVSTIVASPLKVKYIYGVQDDTRIPVSTIETAIITIVKSMWDYESGAEPTQLPSPDTMARVSDILRVYE